MEKRFQTLPSGWARHFNATDVPFTYSNDSDGDSNGATVFYLWGPTGLVMEFDGVGGSRTFTWDPQGNCLATAGLINRISDFDANGIVLQDGVAEFPIFYDGYGLPVWMYPHDRYDPDAIPYNGWDSRWFTQPFQYKGQFGYVTDMETGLCYCHNRYYDPQSGRWITRDPIGLEGGTNVYQYCEGNPIMFADPFGTSGDVGAPTGLGGYEDCIPVWGSGRDAIHEFQTGKWGWGLFHCGVAISDIFLVKSLVVGGAKVAGKVSLRAAGKMLAEDGFQAGGKKLITQAGIAKLTGSTSRGAVRSWMGRQGMVKAGEIMHHCGIRVNSKVGKVVPDIVKNQPWNYLKITDGSIKGWTARVAHDALHGVGEESLSPLQRFIYGTPASYKFVPASVGGHAIGHRSH